MRRVRAPVLRLIENALTDPEVVPLKSEISFTEYRYFPFGAMASQDGDGTVEATLTCVRIPVAGSRLKR